MEMTINEIIKYLPAPICGDTVIGEEKQKEYDAHDTAVNILRKYQKIERIISAPIRVEDSNIRYKAICEVVENGNDD